MNVTVKKLGVVGSLSRTSTITCHERINREVRNITGNRKVADLATWSLDPDHIIRCLAKKYWAAIADAIRQGAENLFLEDIEGIMIAGDTLHCVLEHEEIDFGDPIIHIRDAVIEEVRNQSLKKVGFIGTSVTMNGAYYRDFIQGSDGIDVVLPRQILRANIDYSISNRICGGEATHLEIETFSRILSDFESQNVDGIVVATPEIFLASNRANPIPVLHTARIHAEAAARWCVSGRSGSQADLQARDAAARAPGMASRKADAADLSIAVSSAYPGTLPYDNKAAKRASKKARTRAFPLEQASRATRRV